MNGKGSKPRPLSIPKDTYDKKWDNIFNKPPSTMNIIHKNKELVPVSILKESKLTQTTDFRSEQLLNSVFLTVLCSNKDTVEIEMRSIFYDEHYGTRSTDPMEVYFGENSKWWQYIPRYSWGEAHDSNSIKSYFSDYFPIERLKQLLPRAYYHYQLSRYLETEQKIDSMRDSYGHMNAINPYEKELEKAKEACLQLGLDPNKPTKYELLVIPY